MLPRPPSSTLFPYTTLFRSTSFLDKTHGYLNGTSVFTFPEGYMDLGGQLTVIPHSSFKKITTPLAVAKDGISADNNAQTDRKSTRLNSSHVRISYAVFCLKK